MIFAITLLILVSIIDSTIIPEIHSSSKFNTISKTNIAQQYQEDAYLDFKNLAIKYGYPVEEHIVVSGDGYVLKVFRIPHGKNNIDIGPPVLMMHGFTFSADSWIFPGPDYGLGYLVADAGYDVWCGNYRGNKYSRKHISLDPDRDVKFWQFSYDEMGAHDIPAMADYILKVRGLKKMNYVGYSQGTAMFYAMAAHRPEYYSKFNIMISLAPVAWLTHLYNPHIRSLVKILPEAQAFFNNLGYQEILADSSAYAQISRHLCKGVKKTGIICRDLLFELLGHDEEQFRDELLPVIYGHTPCGASLQNIVHLGQGVISSKFKRFDMGPQGNLKAYGSQQPPEYNVSLITTPVALIYGRNDWLSSPIDVAKLRKKLPNVVDSFLVPREKWQHGDHIWGREAPRLIGDRIVRLLNKYSK